MRARGGGIQGGRIRTHRRRESGVRDHGRIRRDWAGRRPRRARAPGARTQLRRAHDRPQLPWPRLERGAHERDLLVGGIRSRHGGRLIAERRSRPGGARRARAPGAGRLVVRLGRQQGGRVLERSARALGGRPRDRHHRALPGIVRQPAPLRPHRPPGRAHQADRRAEEREHADRLPRRPVAHRGAGRI